MGRYSKSRHLAGQYPTRDKYASNVQGTCMLAWDRWVYWHVKQRAVLATVAEGAVACRAREAQLDNLAGKLGAYLDLVKHLAGTLWTLHAVKAVERGDDLATVREALERHMGLRVGVEMPERNTSATAGTARLEGKDEG